MAYFTDMRVGTNFYWLGEDRGMNRNIGKPHSVTPAKGKGKNVVLRGQTEASLDPDFNGTL